MVVMSNGELTPVGSAKGIAILNAGGNTPAHVSKPGSKKGGK